MISHFDVYGEESHDNSFDYESWFEYRYGGYVDVDEYNYNYATQN